MAQAVPVDPLPDASGIPPVAGGRVVGSSSDWLTVEFGTEPDQAFVLELAKVAAAAHRPPPGSTALPPPTGAALARRRRFH